ncbi:organic hydroperoxide resistance protein [Microbacterium sediminicola]
MKIFYRATATATGAGRDGHVESDDGLLNFDLATPKPRQQPEKTNPEQLFAAGYAACFHSALKMAAKSAGVDLTDSSVTAEVGIGMNLKGGFQLHVELRVHVPGGSEEELRKVLDKAEQTCPYSNATRGNIGTKIRLDTSAAVAVPPVS